MSLLFVQSHGLHDIRQDVCHILPQIWGFWLVPIS